MVEWGDAPGLCPVKVRDAILAERHEHLGAVLPPPKVCVVGCLFVYTRPGVKACLGTCTSCRLCPHGAGLEGLSVSGSVES